MENKLEILLVEDDTFACNEFANEIANTEDMVLISVTNNATKALEYISIYQPHVVILDLELHTGSGSGLQVLQSMHALSLDRKPYFLITTNNSSNTTYEIARNLGADYIMPKHQEGYSVQKVIEFLRLIGKVIKNSPYSNGSIRNTTTETTKQKEHRISQCIMTELNHVGISPKSVGYTYLTEAIEIMLKEPTHNICTLIADRHNKTESSVERAMQNAINRAWRLTSIDDLLQFYTAKINSSKGVPTLTEFICYYATKLKSKY